MWGAGLAGRARTGAAAAAEVLARQASPVPHTTLTVERASGSWVRSLRLTGVSLTRPDSATGTAVSMAQVDTLAVSYRLGALLRGRLHLSEVSVHGPSLTLRQAADSTWDWARALAGDATTALDDTSAGRPIRIDRVRVAEGRFAAQFYAGGRDSTARIRDLSVRARALRLAPTLEGRLDTLGLRAHLPADTSTLRLAARAALSDRRLDLDTLRLTSPRSDVAGRGTARLPLGPRDTPVRRSERTQEPEARSTVRVVLGTGLACWAKTCAAAVAPVSVCSTSSSRPVPSRSAAISPPSPHATHRAQRRRRDGACASGDEEPGEAGPEDTARGA